jgi:molecular chaperone DnaK
MGAAIQAGASVGEIKDVLLLDVTPLSLGIETDGGVVHRMMERNTTIPTKRSELFTTVTDLQASVGIHVVQGEHERAEDNTSLGSFELLDLQHVEGDAPQIEVTFDIDGAGIIQVSAKHRATGKAESMTVTGRPSPRADDTAQVAAEVERGLRSLNPPERPTDEAAGEQAS